MSQLNSLTAISPLDGRYRPKTARLAQYFSEFALIKYRVKVEILYFMALSDFLPQLTPASKALFEKLKEVYQNFSEADALEIKNIEQETHHDVKAVEYFIKHKMDQLGMAARREFVHFGLTSQDINNTAIPLSLKDASREVMIPAFNNLIKTLWHLAVRWKNIPMLARTHGQPASPTRLGKEFEVFIARLNNQLEVLKRIPYAGKFGGATGNMNAHYVAFPNRNWHGFAKKFVETDLGLRKSEPTTQIEHYDHLAEWFDACKRLNTILIDLCRDVWAYMSMNYFTQKTQSGEVGSSTMPHKVNPIDFENAEGNLGIANAVFEHLAAKLPISRLQRDLTDSTVLRNIGVPVTHTYLALESLMKGLGKIECNQTAIERDLHDNWAVVTEAVQTILRREGFPKPYETLKALTGKNEKITEQSIKAFIQTLDVAEAVKRELLAVSPFNYLGR